MIYDIGFQRYRDNKFRVCGKDSIPLDIVHHLVDTNNNKNIPILPRKQVP